MTDLRGSELTSLMTGALRHAPEWVRHDLGARDRVVRVRAEETLAAMIAAALTSGGQPERQTILPRGQARRSGL